MNRFFTRITLVLFLGLACSFSSQAQIYAPEGLNIPGDWNNWSNPPTNTVFAGESQTSGGKVHLVSLAHPFYQTIFHVATVGGDVTSGSYSFKFTSGPASGIWKNQWGDVTVQTNTIQQYTYGVANISEPQPNTITLENGKWYVVNWDNIGYKNTDALFMTLSKQPVNILSVKQVPLLPTDADSVSITISTSAVPSPEEKIYLRYSSDNWKTSQFTAFSFSNDTGSAIIPPFGDNTQVSFYVFSTVFSQPKNQVDLATIHFNNNDGQNYHYTVGSSVTCTNGAVLISTSPVLPLDTSAVRVTFNAAMGDGGLAGYNDTVYAHTGVITTKSVDSHDWKHVKTKWGENTAETMMTRTGTDLYQLYIPNIRTYYGLKPGEKVLKLAFVFRSKKPVSGKTYLQGKTIYEGDIFTPVYTNTLNVRITYPTRGMIVGPNVMIPVCVSALKADSLHLFIDDTLMLKASGGNSLSYALNSTDYSIGYHWLVAKATDSTKTAVDSVRIFIRKTPPVADLPNGVVNGINYINDSTVTLVLDDPPKLKKFVFVIGDFNDWNPTQSGYMNRTPDGEHFWKTITGLKPGVEYAYQYYIDGKLKLADPYCDKILDPYNDKWIPNSTYPNLKPYPFGKTLGIVSVLQTAQKPYNWKVKNFTPVAEGKTQSNLIIYELLIRDFVKDRHISTIIDSLDYLKSLGVNAIELMPFNEFEGNDSWGYNPDFYFAPDKAYGTKNDYKAFIDACHEKGIAVIMDIALNHSFGQSPMVQMYWNNQLKRPAADNPWYNPVAPHPLSPGYDFNHESPYTKAFSKRIFAYWMTQYKIDGFRLDLSKGFTQTYSGNNLSLWGKYDQSRINILTDYYHSVKKVNPNAYFILEHFSDNDEEVVLANTGMLLWGNLTENFDQASMGYEKNSDFSWAWYSDRGYQYPNLIPYMESHDQERMMYQNLTYGNASGSYNIKDTLTALERVEAVAPLFFAIPGPKMLWQFEELGYDYSINYCPDGTINTDCRTSAKPVRWDYWQDSSRQKLYEEFAGLARLKTENQAFLTGTFTKDLSGTGKRAWVTDASLNVSIGSNLDVKTITMKPGFQHTGTWYNYFTGNTIQVNDAAGYSMTMKPGAFYVFTDKKLTRPFVELTFKVVYSGSNAPVPNVEISLGKYGKHTTGAYGLAHFTPVSNAGYPFVVHFSSSIDTSGTVHVDEKNKTVTIRVVATGVESNAISRSLKVYPNPASRKVIVNTQNPGILILSSINGRVLMHRKVEQGKTVVDVSVLRPGMYFLKYIGEKHTQLQKLIVR